MTFHSVKEVPETEIDVMHLGASKLGVIISGGSASIAMEDGATGHRAQCPVDRAQLLALAGLMTDAAERLRASCLV